MITPPSIWCSLAMVMLIASTSCGDDHRVAPRVHRDLTRELDPRPIDIPLAPRQLRTQADFDALEDEYLQTMGAERVIQVYELLAQGASGARDADAILIQRLAMLHLGASTGSERLQKVFAWADKLRAANPKGAHSLYLLAHIKRMLLIVGSKDGTFRLNSRNEDIAQKLLTDWDELLRVAPTYVGPSGSTADDVRQERDRLAAVLAGRKSAAPKTTGALDKPRKASDGERLARTDLWRFEHGSNANRSTLCAERDEKADTGGRSELEMWIDLKCATVQGKPEAALKLLGALELRISRDARCRLLPALMAESSRWGRPIPTALTKMADRCNTAPVSPPATTQ